MKHKTVLVTGGAGFLGSHLCERLLSQGHRVLALDNLSTGSLANLAPLRSKSRFEFVQHDVTQPFDYSADWIFNLASPASPVHYQRDPIHTTLTNVLGTLHCLLLAQRYSARILQASTSEVYGDAEVHPQPESYQGNVNPIGIRSCYDEGKRCAESLLMDFHRTEKVDVRLVRIFNTYGPRMAIDDGRVISNLVVQALRGDELTIYGDGTQTRSFCYVDDLVDGLLQMMGQSREVGPVNLGNPAEFTMLELAELILELTDAQSQIVFRPLPSDDPKQRRPDIRRAREVFDFQPQVPLREGLRRTIAHFAAVLERQSRRLSAHLARKSNVSDIIP